MSGNGMQYQNSASRVSRLSREGPLVQVMPPLFANSGGQKLESRMCTPSPKQSSRLRLPSASDMVPDNPSDGGMNQSALPLLSDELRRKKSFTDVPPFHARRTDPIDTSKITCLPILYELRDWISIMEASKSLAESNDLMNAQRVQTVILQAISFVHLQRFDDAENVLRSLKDSKVDRELRLLIQFIGIRLGYLKGALSYDAAVRAYRLFMQDIETACSKSSPSPLCANLSAGTLNSWTRRIRVALSNIFVANSMWRNALAELQAIVDGLNAEICTKNKPKSSDDATDSDLLREIRGDINSRIGHIFLRTGNIDHAAIFFRRSDVDWGHSSDSKHHAHSLINRGLLEFARGDYRSAYELNEKAATEARIHREISATSQRQEVGVRGGIETVGICTLIAIASNNAALSHLYACDMDASLSTLQNAMKESAVSALRNTPIFNLCSLYDLSEGHSVSREQKISLLEYSKNQKLSDLNMKSFRM